jgi:hypothetical protein
VNSRFTNPRFIDTLFELFHPLDQPLPSQTASFCLTRFRFQVIFRIPKIEAIKSWLIPATLTQLRSFLDLARLYQCFVKDFSTIAAPLNDLPKKGVPFYWNAAQEPYFNTLIDKLTHAPLLQLPNFSKTFKLECDASGIEIGGVLL